MVIAQRVDGDAGKQIEISLVLLIDQVGAGASIRQKLVTAVGSKQILLFQFFDVIKLHKAESLA